MINKLRRNKLLILLGVLVLFILLAIFLFSGDNFILLKSIFAEKHTNEELQEKLGDFGIKGYITIAILSMLQVTLPFLPAEPVQVIAGIAFGFPIGILCCTVGVILGNLFIFIMYKIYGEKIHDYFVKNIHLDFDKTASSKKIVAIIFALYFLPAIPYGMICFLAASVKMKLPRYMTVTVLGAIPSICIGVGLGHIAIEVSWFISIAVCLVLVTLLTVLMLKRETIFSKINKYLDTKYSSKTVVQKCSPFVIDTAYIISKIALFFKGVKVKYTNKVGEIENPSIVLCNHGSFLDFVYAGTLIRKKRPNFIVARLYFYKKLYAKIMRKGGCFPKSMFTSDLDSAKNCLRVLKNGDVLAMMPEARLSTAGQFEDIQEGTYSFLKKADVPIYIIKLRGDYFASPKWGNGLRRNSYIEAEIDLLLSKEQIDSLSVTEMKEIIEREMYYNDFDWLKSHPELRYKSKTLAEGLENILVRCPKCGAIHSIRTKKRRVYCEKCDLSLTLNDRYEFLDNPYFKTFADWYRYQCNKINGDINESLMQSGDYKLTSKVELKLPSLDGSTLLRHGGEGVCVLNKDGLTYTGTKDGCEFEIQFPLSKVYRLLFGAGEDFEAYYGSELYYFIPEEKRSAVEWYITSKLLYDSLHQESLVKA
ncbi:MAG: VTT domain-containing protein [Clostridia bacterium]|nr:VTT domain-containing protein [Clostridia bacterium]